MKRLVLFLFLLPLSLHAQIAVTGTANANNGNFSATAGGDLKIVFAFRSNSLTPPALPAGWTNIASGGSTGSGTNAAYRIGCNKSADGTATAVGYWVNAANIVGVSLAGTLVNATADCNTTGIGGKAANNAESSTTASFNSITMTDNSGNSWVLGFLGDTANSNCTPTGMSLRVSSLTSYAWEYDTNGGVTSWTTQTCTVSSGTWMTYVLEALANIPQAAQPTYDPVAGTYAAPQSVTISTGTAGATICYTTDGSTPTASAGTCTSGTTYSTPVSIGTAGQNSTTTLKAIASKSGYSNSTVASGSYVIQYAAEPTITPAAGKYLSQRFIKYSCSTPSSTIHYTTDGSTPTTGSTAFVNVTAPSPTTSTASTGGTLAGNNVYRYYITSKTATGETLKSAAVDKSVPAGTNTNTVTLDWTKPATTVTGYRIWGRVTTEANVGLLATINSGDTLTWTDDGSITPTQQLHVITNRQGYPLEDTSGVPSGTSGTQTWKAICAASGYGDSSVLSVDYILNPTFTESVSNNFDGYSVEPTWTGGFDGPPLDEFWTNNDWMQVQTITNAPDLADVNLLNIGLAQTCTQNGHHCILTSNAPGTSMLMVANLEDTYSADQYASIRQWDGEDHTGGVCVRCLTDGNHVVSGYFMYGYAAQDGEEVTLPGRMFIGKVVNGTETVWCRNDGLYTSDPSTPINSTGPTYKLEIAGSSIRPSINGNPVPGCQETYTDTTFTQGYPGIVSKAVARNAVGLTEFRAGNGPVVANSSPLIPNWAYDTYTDSGMGIGNAWPWTIGTIYHAFVSGGVAVPGVSGKTGAALNSNTTSEVFYLAPFNPTGQFQEFSVAVDTNASTFDFWFAQLEHENWKPGSTDGGCAAAGNSSCANSSGYQIGVKPANADRAANGDGTACAPLAGQYACTPFAHVRKTTPVPAQNSDSNAPNYCGGTYNPATHTTGCNNVVTVAASLITPMKTDVWGATIYNNHIKVACKRTRSYSSFEENHLYSTSDDPIVDSNGNFQRVQTGGTSAGSAPTWATTWDSGNHHGTYTVSGGATFEYYGRPCAGDNAFALVMEADDSDMDGRTGYAGINIGANANVPVIYDWTAGTSSSSTACDLWSLCSASGDQIPRWLAW